MSPEHKSMLAILAGGSVVVPWVVGFALGWPTWLWGSLILVLLTITAMVGRHHYEQDQQRKLYDPRWAGQLDYSARQHPVSGIRLDSDEPGYKFLFSGTVCWSSIHPEAGVSPSYQEHYAIKEIVARASSITANRQPEDHVVVENELAVALGTPLAVQSSQSGQLRVWVTDIVLAIPEGDVGKLGELSELRMKINNWNHEREFNRQMRLYLKQDVLADPGSAVLWWLAQHTDEPEKAVSLIKSLTQLVDTVTTDVPKQFLLDPAINFVNQLFPNPDDPQRVEFADILIKVIASYEVENDCVKNLQEIVEGGTVARPQELDQ